MLNSRRDKLFATVFMVTVLNTNNEIGDIEIALKGDYTKKSMERIERNIKKELPCNLKLICVKSAKYGSFNYEYSVTKAYAEKGGFDFYATDSIDYTIQKEGKEVEA